MGRPGYLLVNDSNLDWNQALPQVESFVQQRSLNHFLLDEYGFSEPNAYVPQAQFWSCQGASPADGGQWAVVSASSIADGHNSLWLMQYPHEILAGGSMYAIHLPPVIPSAGTPGGPPLPEAYRYLGGFSFFASDPRLMFLNCIRDPLSSNPPWTACRIWRRLPRRRNRLTRKCRTLKRKQLDQRASASTRYSKPLHWSGPGKDGFGSTFGSMRRRVPLFSMKPAIFPTFFLVAAMVACGGGGAGTTTAVSSASSGGPWQKVNLPSAATQVNYIAFNSSDHWFVADRRHGFYRSTDQGATWTQINSGMATTLGWTINVNPANGDLIASIVSGSTLNAHPVNFYRSTDEGNSWTLIPSVHISSVTALTGCVFAPNTNVVCGGYWSPFPNSGAWVSTDGGLTTTAATTSPNNGGGVFGLGVNPVAGDLWLGTEQMGIFRSTDNGFTWTQASPPDLQIDPVHGIRDGNIYGMTFDRNGNVLFASQGGIWKSSRTGSGYTWTNVLKNQNTSAGKSLARDANGNLYYGHDQDKMNPTVVYRSTDDGSTWSAYDAGIPLSLQGRQFAVNPADGRLYAVITDEASGSGWLYRTVNAVQ